MSCGVSVEARYSDISPQPAPNVVSGVLDSLQRTSAMICHLLVPGLVPLEKAGHDGLGDIELPALEALMARGTRTRIEPATLDKWLAAAFNPDRAKEVAAAPYSVLGEGCDPGSYGWLCADPVHLQLQGAKVVLTESSRLDIAADEARQMLETLNAHFSGRNLFFFAPVPQRWYVRTTDTLRLRTAPTDEVVGKDIKSHLPAGDDRSYWHGVLNEAQMVLHGHECNEQRERRGELPINSLWLWGAGRIEPSSTRSPYHCVWSDHPLARGLAISSDIESRALPESGKLLVETAVATAPKTGSLHLIVLPRLPHAKHPNTLSWREDLMWLERNWLAPFLAAMQRGPISALTLYAVDADDGWSLAFARKDRFRFWRRRKRIFDIRP